MTTRDMGFAFLKFMGVYYFATAVLSFLNTLGWLGMTPTEGVPSPRTMAVMAFTSLLAYAVLSFCCLFLTNTLSSWLFGDDPEPTLTVGDPERFLTVGIILIGVALLGSNLATIVRFVAELFWNLEGSRRPLIIEGFLTRAWYGSGSSIGTAIVGAFLIARGDRVAQRLSPWHEREDDVELDDAEAN